MRVNLYIRGNEKQSVLFTNMQSENVILMNRTHHCLRRSAKFRLRFGGDGLTKETKRFTLMKALKN